MTIQTIPLKLMQDNPFSPDVWLWLFKIDQVMNYDNCVTKSVPFAKYSLLGHEKYLGDL